MYGERYAHEYEMFVWRNLVGQVYTYVRILRGAWMWYNGKMEIKREDIVHLAELSDFSLNDKEIESLGSDLRGIIQYISQLEELDTGDVEPTYQVFEMSNVWRADEVLPQDATREELLALTKEEKDNQVKVPKVL